VPFGNSATIDFKTEPVARDGAAGSEEGVMYRASIFFLFLFSFVWAQTNEPLSVSLEAYVVTVMTKDDGTTEEKFSEAATARPGQIVEYRVIVMNTSNETVPGSSAFIVGPVPASTDYLVDTATLSSDAARLEFSADGGQSFADKPMVLKKNDEGEEELVAALPEEYTDARWQLLQALAPQESLTFSYRVTVR
jgi:uncharacterized repeat protein (TIGR01451 family)